MKQKNIQTTNVIRGGHCLTANKIHKKKAVQLLSRAVLCSILAAGVFSFSNNTYAESITDDDGDKTITDTIVNAESVSASNGHTITFEGNDSISLVSVDSATPKMQAQNSSYLKFGSAEQKINNIYKS